MSSKFAAISDAIVAALNAATLSQTFNLTRNYVAVQSEPALTTLTLTVVPVDAETAQAARGRALKDLNVGILIQKKIAATSDPESTDPTKNVATNAEIDSLLYFAEQVADLWQPGTPSLAPGQWLKTTHKPIFDVQKLRELRIFESIVILTLKFQA